MSKRNLRLIFVAIAIVAIAIYFIPYLTTLKEEQKPVAVTQELPLVDKNGVGALGRIEPRTRVIAVSHDAGPEGARIERLQVEEGQQVKAGEVLAYFSNHSRKKAELYAAQSNSEVLKAKLQASQAEATIAGRELARSRTLLNEKIISESHKDEDELRFRQANANVKALEAEITASKANILLAEEQLKQTFLLAPISGTVLKIYSFAGERVGDKGVLEMADLSHMDVVAEVYERDISKIKMGQKATIHIPGMENDITGEVRELGFQVRKNDINDTDPLADRDNRIVEVRISVAEDRVEALKHLLYMQVNVRISL